MRIFNIIKKPVLTEKTYKQMENKRKFVFEVNKDSAKTEIKKAFETLFEVKVESINTQNKDGKPKRMGRYEGRKNHTKRAIITLKPGQNLDILTGENSESQEVISEKLNKELEASNVKEAKEIVEEAKEEATKHVESSKKVIKKPLETHTVKKPSAKKIVANNVSSKTAKVARPKSAPKKTISASRKAK